jgi:WD40 repeat protein
MSAMKDIEITPSRTVVTSFNPKTTAASQQQKQQKDENDYFEEGDWVLCVTNTEQWISCALSNGEIQVYDKEKLLQTNCYMHQSGLVTDLCRDYTNPNLLAATATDGTLTLFDIRQAHQPAFQMRLPRQEEEALSVSIGFDGNIAAVGSSKAKIHFFDVRNTKNLVGGYSQSHTNEVTRVRFQTMSSFGTTTTTTSMLVSGAEDGLACVFDTSLPSEEEALTNVLNVQSPVREVGFFGPQSEAIYVLTGSESLLLYHKDDPACRKNFGPELRARLSQQIAPKSAPFGYLVDCHWDVPRQELLLLAGSVKGDAGVFRVNEQDVALAHYLHGGHRGVLRAWQPLSSNLFVTVGEDARMCEWNRIGRQINAAAQQRPPVVIMPKRTTPTVRAGGGKLRRPRSRLTASPY